MMASISNEQKTKIITDFLCSAPPGEFTEVFNDVRVLVGDDGLLEAGAKAAAAKYNETQLLPVELPDQTKSMVSIFGLVEGNTYVDPSSQKTFDFDHLKKEASSLRPVEGSDDTATWREAVQKAVAPYTAEHYPSGLAVVYGSIVDGDVKITVCIENHKFSTANYCNGRWRSVWQATVGDETANVVGKAQIQVHYYEDGNVQLHTSTEFSSTIPAKDEAGMAAAFVKLISQKESQYQADLNDDYSTMSSTTFKCLRRALPLTRTKIDWNKIINYRLGQEMHPN